ncbi:MAG: hypothetical protein WCS65_14460 [Verrucomicrobiae bacterium]
MKARTVSAGMRRGFTLIEVVLTLGIAVFALVTMVGLFQALFSWSRGISDRREVMQAMDSLTASLNTDTNAFGFSNVFGLMRANATNELTFVRYRADASGSPATNGSQMAMKWLPADSATADYEAAHSGRWIKAKISLSTNNNPVPSLTNDLASYPYARLILRVDYFAVGDPGQAASSNNFVLTAHQTVLR